MTSPKYDPRPIALLEHLRNLPSELSDHPNIYPFPNFTLDASDISFYTSPQNALSHHLDLIFGSRHDNQPDRFKGRGSSLEAVVEVLHHHITGDTDENTVLWTWVHDLTCAAQAYNQKLTPKVEEGSGRKRQSSLNKQNKARKRKNKPSKARITAAKACTAIKYPHDPADLEDDELVVYSIGHPRDELLDRLTLPCHSITNPSKNRFRCRGTACGWSCAEPRNTLRVLRHAQVCSGLDESLRQESMQRRASLSLAARLRERVTSVADEDEIDDLEARQLKTERVNHALLKPICDRMTAPSVVNCTKWHEFVHTLDENITTASGSTVVDNYVTTEAAYIRHQSVKALSERSNLTITFDGGTTRAGESIYATHITDPATGEAYLIEGNEASGVSHTGEHIEAILDKIITEVGPLRFTCAVSDNAGNTRAARKILGTKYPWIVTLFDACHHQNNTAKDIGSLPHFRACISQLKSIIKFFHSSSFARRHLAALCALSNVHGGLEADGKTRFVTIYYAARSVLRCIAQILELFSSGVLDPSSNSPVYWLLDLPTVQKFTVELRQLVVVLEPLARYKEIFKGNTTLLGSALPQAVIDDITSILNGRYSEMFHGKTQQIYATAFFLDPRFRGADLLRGSVSNHLYNTDSKIASARLPTLPADHDLRQAFPVYAKAGEYLLRILANIYNANPALPLFIRYNNIWSNIESNLREQLMRFTRSLSLFHRSLEAATRREYWEEMSTVAGADLLSHLGVLISSVVPNSMAEERTMSVITKMNSPDRASREVSTLFDMAMIRQYYKREEAAYLSRHRACPTVRFADLSKYTPPISADQAPQIGAEYSASEDFGSHSIVYADPDALESENEPADRSELGSQDVFEVEAKDGVLLTSKLLTDILIDIPVPSQASHCADIAELAPMQSQAHQPVDVSTIVY